MISEHTDLSTELHWEDRKWYRSFVSKRKLVRILMSQISASEYLYIRIPSGASPAAGLWRQRSTSLGTGTYEAAKRGGGTMSLVPPFQEQCRSRRTVGFLRCYGPHLQRRPVRAFSWIQEMVGYILKAIYRDFRSGSAHEFLGGHDTGRWFSFCWRNDT